MNATPFRRSMGVGAARSILSRLLLDVIYHQHLHRSLPLLDLQPELLLNCIEYARTIGVVGGRRSPPRSVSGCGGPENRVVVLAREARRVRQRTAEGLPADRP